MRCLSLPVVMCFPAQGPDAHYLETMRRSACLAVCTQERRGIQLSPVEEDSVEDDDLLYPCCFCQQPRGGNFMITCDQQGVNCHKWFHCVCVCGGIYPEEGRCMETHNELLFVHHVLEFLPFQHSHQHID